MFHWFKAVSLIAMVESFIVDKSSVVDKIEIVFDMIDRMFTSNRYHVRDLYQIERVIPNALLSVIDRMQLRIQTVSARMTIFGELLILLTMIG